MAEQRQQQQVVVVQEEGAFSRIPQALLVSVLRKVSEKEEGFEYATVCQSWLEASQEAQARFIVSQGSQILASQMCRQLNQFRDISFAEFQKKSIQCGGDGILSALSKFRNLESLVLKRDAITWPSESDYISELGIGHLFSSCPKLKTVKLHIDLPHCKELPESVTSLMQIQRLEFWTCSQSWKDDPLQSVNLGLAFNLHGFQRIPQGMIQLTSLKALHITLNDSRGVHDVIFHLLGLQELHLESDASHNLQGISNLSALRKLHISQPNVELPRSFSYLFKLEELCLFCNTLVDAPLNLASLHKLKMFAITSTILSLPEFVTSISTLTALSLVCPNLQQLPENLGSWSSLKSLDLYRCLRLNEIPETVYSFTKLTKLAMGKAIFQLPRGLSSFSNLTHLDIQLDFGHEQLPDFLSSLQNLRTLHIAACTKLTTLGNFLGSLTSLTTLIVEHCRGLLTLCPHICPLQSLTKVTLLACPLLQLPEDMGSLENLLDLSVFQCGCTELPASFPQLKKVQKLMIWLPELRALPDDFGNLSSLEQLVLSGRELQFISDSISQLPKLRFLILEDLPELLLLPPSFTDLTSLSELRIKECPKLKVDLLSLHAMKLSTKSKECLRSLLLSGNVVF